MKTADVQDRAVGVLFGLAAGDRIGGPLRMALLVAESLRDRGGFDASDISGRYLEWWRQGAFDTGGTAARVLSLAACGMSFERAMTQADDEAGGMTAGCNPAHRSAPLAICAAIEDGQIAEAAIAEARITHRHPLAGDVAAAVGCLCRALIRGTEWPAALRLAAADRSPVTRRAIEIQSADRLSPGGFAPDVLRAAVFFVGAAGSFADALARAIDFAGPANYCPVLVGSIGGARWGRSQIEDGLLDHHGKLATRLTAVARGLAMGFGDETACPD